MNLLLILNNKRYALKISIILCLFIFIFTIYISYGVVDNFYPRNLLGLIDIVNYGDSISQPSVGCYQAFSSMICILMGIDVELLHFIPIMLIPLLLLFILLLHRLSNNIILSIIIAGLIFGFINYSSNIVLWIHTCGLVLYLLYLNLIIIVCKEHKTKSNNPVFVCMIITLISTNYTSYNYMALEILSVSFLLILYMLYHSKYKHNNTCFNDAFFSKSQLIIIGVIGVLFIFELNSFYTTFLSFGENMMTTGVSIVDKIILKIEEFFTGYHSLATNPLFEFYKPSTFSVWSIFSIIKLIICIVTVIIYLIYIFKENLIKMKNLSPNNLVIISSLLGGLLYIFIRLIFIGNLSSYSLLIMLSMLPLLYMTSKHECKKYNTIFCILLVIFLISTPISLAYNYSYSISENKNTDSNIQINSISQWIYDYSVDDVDSDVYTYSELLLLTHSTDKSELRNIGTYFLFRDLDEVLSIFNIRNKKYTNDVVINWHLPTVSVSTSDWVSLSPWTLNKQRIISNHNYDIIYGSGQLSYLNPT